VAPDNARCAYAAVATGDRASGVVRTSTKIIVAREKESRIDGVSSFYFDCQRDLGTCAFLQMFCETPAISDPNPPIIHFHRENNRATNRGIPSSATTNMSCMSNVNPIKKESKNKVHK